MNESFKTALKVICFTLVCCVATTANAKGMDFSVFEPDFEKIIICIFFVALPITFVAHRFNYQGLASFCNGLWALFAIYAISLLVL